MTKKPARRSIVSSFGAMSLNASEVQADEKTLDVAPAPSLPTTPRVPAGVIGAAQRTLSDIREERDRLQAIVDAGIAGLAELNAELIDPSPFPDRLPDDGSAAFDDFKRSIAEDGQRVPVQVRPHPDAPERYQVIYGHRRVRAARELGIPVKALVRQLTDTDLVVSQGLENASRQDLSWIEKAVFARQMEGAGVRARDIRGALSIDDPELARMRSVWRAVPSDMIIAIGRAPKVGRPRWVELAALLAADPVKITTAWKILSADKVRAELSDVRFQIVLGSLADANKSTEAFNLEMAAGGGRSVGKAVFGEREIRLKVDAKAAIEFKAFFKQELPALIERFEASRVER
ncbi:plasmid partitioning protein RepB [Bosea sp. 685]|uniref:plasmid partitioning protein RepB n=1 Tax=Bosea sp. 685 TaxID=3080057 RepID=UPI002892C3DB|nr:plasmid partitioning protein RepB [Bosea sp. 685]WNJ87953.1 plasmid partitioning protein RepB [Bosea sp. 685]